MHLDKHNNINNFVLHSTVTESCSEATCCWREGEHRFRVLCWIRSVACSHMASYGQTRYFNFLTLPFLLVCTDAHREKCMRTEKCSHSATFLTPGMCPHLHTHIPCIMVYVSSFPPFLLQFDGSAAARFPR